MSLLDDARRMVEHGFIRRQPTLSGRMLIECVICYVDPSNGHDPECPVPSLPRIAAALEAAERVRAEYEDVDFNWDTPDDFLRSLEVLVAALRGEGEAS
jgi:hypothetical protein